MLNTVCLTFDFDAMSVWLGGYPRVTPAMLSRGEFGARVGVPRILELLARYDIHATFFTPGHTAESFPEMMAAIVHTGHEVGHHGYGHEDPGTQTPVKERASLERGLATLEKVTYMRTHAPGGVLTLTMHPQVIGRGHRMAMLEQLIKHFLAAGSVRFARLIDVAQEEEEEEGGD
jgi:peptidoglycan/xylan/chitin deacetylase (PgdA/CDA1 family)